MIVSISGRKGSGKSLLSQELINRGFQRVSFADHLKELLAKLYGWPLDDMYDPKAKEKPLLSPVIWDQEHADTLAVLANTPELSCVTTRYFYNIREALQYVGTEVLRKYDPDFHVKATKKRLKRGNYVFDDTRFPNELRMLKKKGATCIFVMRPGNFKDCSNHDSEISLRRQDFKYVLLNTSTKQALLQKFKVFLSCLNDPVMRGRDVRDDAFSKATPESAYWMGILSQTAKFKKRSNHYALSIHVEDAVLSKKLHSFLKTNKSVIANHYLLEDLKWWNMQPNGEHGVPDAIQGDNELIWCWMLGVLHMGRSSTVAFTKNNMLKSVTYIMPTQIANYVQKFFQGLGSQCCLSPLNGKKSQIRIRGTNIVKMIKFLKGATCHILN
jgi:hypothetical protein